MLVAEVGTIKILEELRRNGNFLRFYELRKGCKIPQNTLVRRLKQLEKCKLVERRVNSDRSVDYKITKKGEDFLGILLKAKKILLS